MIRRVLHWFGFCYWSKWGDANGYWRDGEPRFFDQDRKCRICNKAEVNRQPK